MANTTRWIIDTNWTAVTFTAGDLNSLASGGGALATSVIANSTPLDMLMDVSFVVTVGATTLVSSLWSLFVLPLNQDGSTYGDGYASSSTTQPALQYGNSIGVKAGVTSGNTIVGTFQFLNLPPGDVKLAVGNNLNIALSGTAALTLKYRSFNTNLNA